MPKYKADFELVDYLLSLTPEKRKEFVETCLKALDWDHERYVFLMCYLFGLRPAELLQLRKEDFQASGDDLQVRLPTVKKGITRRIVLSISSTPFANWLVDYVQRAPSLLPVTWRDTTNINKVFKKLGERIGLTICPYVMREFRLTFLALQGANLLELRDWKGAKDFRSVEPYLRSQPITKFRERIS